MERSPSGERSTPVGMNPVSRPSLQHGAELVEGVEIDHSIAAGAEPGVLPILHAPGDAFDRG